jgi:hypothetical protein
MRLSNEQRVTFIIWFCSSRSSYNGLIAILKRNGFRWIVWAGLSEVRRPARTSFHVLSDFAVCVYIMLE